MITLNSKVAEVVRDNEAEGRKRSKSKKATATGNEKRKYVAMYLNAMNGYPYDKETLEEIRDHMIKRENELHKLNGNARGEVYDLTELIAKINAM